ncbi:MAG: IS1634 family transposase [Nitrospirae bacterium YQR-1]
MYIQRHTKRVGDKVYHSILLVQSFREGKKVKHKTILNLSKWKPEDIAAFEAGLKGKQGFSLEEVQPVAGKSIGALWVFKELAKELGLMKALGKALPIGLVLLLVIGRILTQGSRRHLCGWGATEELEYVLGVKDYSVDTLYRVLDLLAENQEAIEDRLFKQRYNGEAHRLFLYDVTSSYLEGEHNELAAYGYNRDKKSGKKQIVIGLMTDLQGYPVTIEVFDGNTSDLKTLSSQIKKLSGRFGVKEVTVVGDRGMIKTHQIEELASYGMSYITAITKPQIEKLISTGVLQLRLFDNEVVEAFDEQARYVIKRNPVRALEMKKQREGKIQRIKNKAAELTKYLSIHKRASVQKAQERLQEYCDKLKVTAWVEIVSQERDIEVRVVQEKLTMESVLDGCYVIKTDVKDLSAKDVHDRYKALAVVEQAFKKLKTGFLEIRPLFLRDEGRTRAHVFVTMLAYLLIHEFYRRTKHLGLTLQHMIDTLDKVQTVTLTLGETEVKKIPKQRKEITLILEALGIKLPSTNFTDTV